VHNDFDAVTHDIVFGLIMDSGLKLWCTTVFYKCIALSSSCCVLHIKQWFY